MALKERLRASWELHQPLARGSAGRVLFAFCRAVDWLAPRHLEDD